MPLLNRFSPIALALSTFAGVASAHLPPPPLPTLNIDTTQTTVSGISAGGYMMRRGSPMPRIMQVRWRDASR